MTQQAIKVMLIDDDEDTRDVMSKHIQDTDPDAHFDIRTQTDGRLGLADINQEKFDLIVTDFLMPSMNGLEMIEKIRTGCSCNQATPIICITGHLSMVDDKIPAHILSKTDFLEKPYDLDELKSIISEYINSKETVATT